MNILNPLGWLRGRLPLLALAITALPCALGAQLVPEGGRLATRASLERSATALDQWAASTAYSPRTRARAREAASAVRARLANGDFRVGDLIFLRVDGAVALVDTVTVREGQMISVRGLAEVPLAGVLRSELHGRVVGAVTEVARNASVVTRPFIRLAVFGEVNSPGYISLPGDATVDQLITRAGGPTAAAVVSKVQLVRGDTVLLNSNQVAVAITQGQTLDALELRDGDAITIPSRSQPWDRQMTLQIMTLILTPLIATLLVGSN